MTTPFELLLIAGWFGFVSYQTATLGVARRSERFSRGLDRLLLFVPVLAAAVFAVLFAFVLKGRFCERLSHAVLLLALWLYAARFFWFLGSYFKHGFPLILNIAVGLLVTLNEVFRMTPLDRYAEQIHSHMGRASILAGAGMLALFYAAAFLSARAPKGKMEAKEGERAFLDGRDDEAFRLFSESARLGCAAGQYGLGGCYNTGTGVKKNRKEAVKWYRMAAERGHKTAMFDLSACFMNGDGVEKDEAEGMKWLRMAAERNDDIAQLILGASYAKGNGVERDDAEAVKWYRKAAERGVAPAQFELGKCYAEGRGVEKDKAEAEKWFGKAAKRGDEDAKDALRRMRG